MTDELAGDVVIPLNPITVQLAEALVRGSGGRAEIVSDDQQHSLDIEEKTSTMVFVEAEGDQVRVTPFVGDIDAIHVRPYVVTVRPASWLDGEQELVINVAALPGSPYHDEVLAHLRSALDYWARSSDAPRIEPLPSAATIVEVPPPELARVDFSEVQADEEPGENPSADAPTVVAQMRADVSSQWSWASSAARIPQISVLTVALSEPVARARISVTVSDADLQFGSKVVYEGALPAGTSVLNPVHVPLSPRVMSQVDERRGAACAITLEDLGRARVIARVDEAIDIQPRDLWLSKGDPRRGEQQERMIRRFNELLGALQEDPERPDADEIVAELEQLKQALENEPESTKILARSLLASFVRPNHPEVAALAREAAALRGRATGGEASFHAFQIPDIAEAEEAVEASVTAIYEALRGRGVAYSEPPPGWDYESDGQRIRDHGDVARGGLGTCMDTTVLMAAVIEQVGLLPVPILLPAFEVGGELIGGHILIGYWRQDPARSALRPEWYPDSPALDSPETVLALLNGGWLGVIETTTVTVASEVSAAQARKIARRDVVGRIRRGGRAVMIDVAAARRAGVSPLPAIIERGDGVTEIIEYRPGGGSTVTQVVLEPGDTKLRERQVDSHPARYRTWKSDLFSLNATNALLNLGNNARVQPLMLPPEALGFLEDKLNQDVSFSLHSGHDIPEVWKARGVENAIQLLDSGDSDDRKELLGHINERRIYVQRIGRSGGRLTALSTATFFREIRSMTHNAKTAREERGMNPLFLCLGLLRWPYKPGVFAEAPLILVPVNVTVARGRQHITLSLDATQQTTPNAALIEWLRREHALSIPGLAEPLADRAGIDVDGVLAEVRKAVAERGLAFDVAAEARLATLDLSAFRMWQDMNLHAETFIDRPLVRHLVETPTEQFEDPAIEVARPAATEVETAEELEKIDTPIPADSTQKRAVLWAREGRTFVLQGPPGTGKSQTITNMVAECVMSGQRVLFVAEKGTALAVVQRRLDAIGLGPFTLNLHHEGSNATEVRAQLKRSLAASVTPDPAAMESARRRLRNARFELMQYPQHLHEPNAAGLSAYSAHDQLLVLGEGPAMPVPAHLVAHQAEKVTALRELFQNLQPWTAAAAVRPNHPWMLGGTGDSDPFDLQTVSRAVTDILDGTRWAATTTAPLRDTLNRVTHPSQLDKLAAAANRVLPRDNVLAGVLEARWPTAAPEMVSSCERAIDSWSTRLHGFTPEIVQMNLGGIASQLREATASNIVGRSRRQTAAVAPLAVVAPPGLNLQPANAAAILIDLIAAQNAGEAVRVSISSVPGLGSVVPTNPFQPGALQPVRHRLEELVKATAGLRSGDEWTQWVRSLAQANHLSGHADALVRFAHAWLQLCNSLVIDEADFQAWRGGRTLLAATEAVSATWHREVGFERLLPLQHWCALVRKLEPLRDAGLLSARRELLEGSLAAYVAEDALARGVAQASLNERVSAAGLNRFNSVAHDQRVTSYSEAQAEVRQQWVTDGPATLLERRGGRGAGGHTGGLARELEKTTHKLGTRPILRKYGQAVQELTPLVLCSPSSVVDLIEPGVMEFDVVIFDEASQITVPEAVGALGRARAAIVVGDTKQMPPSRRVGGGGLTDEDEVGNQDADEIVEDQESILSECELARVPTLRLNWHYRSQDEALIAFSNRAYYGGELSSFPTPTLLSAETGVQFRRVHSPEKEDKGMYLRAGSAKVELGNGIRAGANTNPIEALEIVRYVERLVHEGDRLPSLGIVTFNEQQRGLIFDLLQASPDPKVAVVMDEAKMGRGEALFVKALEQVQGDERDTVIFSVAFSKQANNSIPTNFGPLSNSGGERRLNVAVTRARRRNIVFCSFDPSELDVSGSTYDGPKDLKEFLTFAKASGASRGPGETAHRVAIRDRHRDDIANALRAAGLHVMSDVGLSNFRIDLVLARPADPTRPILPVLLDGESWRRRATVSDRDVLPVEVLQTLMRWPAVARIWWPMWLQNRQEVIDRILAEVDHAEAELSASVATSTAALEAVSDAPVPAAIVIVEPTFGPATGTIASHTAAAMAEPASTPAGRRYLPPATPATPSTPLAEDPTYRPRRVADELTPEVMEPKTAPAPVAPSAPPSDKHQEGGRAEFVSAHTDLVGSKDVLDALPDRAAAASVRDQVVAVIESEGPIEVARLTRIVARRFGLHAVRAARAEDIAKLIPRGQLRKSRLGSFAWPTGLDPATWTGFRTVDPDASRTLDEVAPEEMANAMQAVLIDRPTSSDEDVLRRTAELFGIVRLGANVRSRLEAVHATLVAASPARFAPLSVSPEPPTR